MSETLVFHKEIQAHDKYLPALGKFVEEHQENRSKNMGIFTVEDNAPQMVYGNCDKEGIGVIVMMDLNDRGIIVKYIMIV